MVRSTNKRSRSRTGSNDTDRINLEITVSPSEKHKTTDNKVQGHLERNAEIKSQGKSGPINRNRRS